MGGDDSDDVDDEVSTTVLSQNHATATLSTEESFLRTQYLSLPSCQQGQEIDGQRNTYRRSQLGSHLSDRPQNI
jgi:hypothetical protein